MHTMLAVAESLQLCMSDTNDGQTSVFSLRLHSWTIFRVLTLLVLFLLCLLLLLLLLLLLMLLLLLLLSLLSCPAKSLVVLQTFQIAWPCLPDGVSLTILFSR